MATTKLQAYKRLIVATTINIPKNIYCRNRNYVRMYSFWQYVMLLRTYTKRDLFTHHSTMRSIFILSKSKLSICLCPSVFRCICEMFVVKICPVAKIWITVPKLTQTLGLFLYATSSWKCFKMRQIIQGTCLSCNVKWKKHLFLCFSPVNHSIRFYCFNIY